MSRIFAAVAAFGGTLAAGELQAAVPYVKAALDEFPGDLRSADPASASLATITNAYNKMKADPGVVPSLSSISALVMSAAANGFTAYMDASDADTATATAAATAAAPKPAPVAASTTAALLGSVQPAPSPAPATTGAAKPAAAEDEDE